MPTKFIAPETGKDAGKRCDMWSFFTYELRLREQHCGRYKQRTPEKYAELRASILKWGQWDPIIIRQDGQVPIILDGMGRYEVICDLNEHELKDTPMKVIAIYKQVNPVDGLWITVNQNRHRSEVDPLDDSFNIQAFKKLNLSDEEIAEGYFPGCLADKKRKREALTWVERRASLLNLTPAAQEKLSDGKMGLTAAENLSRLAEAQQKKAIAKEGKITPADIRAASGKPATVTPKVRLERAKEELDNIVSEFGAHLALKQVIDRIQALRDSL